MTLNWNEFLLISSYAIVVGDNLLWKKTLCMDTIQDLGMSYNTHSLYGWSMAKQTLP